MTKFLEEAQESQDKLTKDCNKLLDRCSRTEDKDKFQKLKASITSLNETSSGLAHMKRFQDSVSQIHHLMPACTLMCARYSSSLVAYCKLQRVHQFPGTGPYTQSTPHCTSRSNSRSNSQANPHNNLYSHRNFQHHVHPGQELPNEEKITGASFDKFMIGIARVTEKAAVLVEEIRGYLKAQGK